MQGQESKFLDDIAKRALKFFLDASHPKTGLTLDRTPNIAGSPGKTNIASTAATGYAITAFCIGTHYGWLDRKTAIVRIHRVLDTLQGGIEGKSGFYYHFINWETGARAWNCELSSIDTALLQMGLLTAAAYFGGSIAQKIDGILRRTEWVWMQNLATDSPDDSCLSMGWKPESGFLESRWNHYDESLFLYILAMGAPGKHIIPISTWKNWKTEAHPETGLFTPVGPLFWSQMTAGYINLAEKHDRYGRDFWSVWKRSHAYHITFCARESRHYKTYREGVFGINACDQPPPVGYGAQEPLPGRHDGTIAPTAMVASSIFDKLAAMQGLSALRNRLGDKAYGYYGFANAVNEDKGWIDPDVLGLDLGMAITCYANSRDRFIWNLLAKQAMIQRGLKAMGMTPKGVRNDS